MDQGGIRPLTEAPIDVAGDPKRRRVAPARCADSRPGRWARSFGEIRKDVLAELVEHGWAQPVDEPADVEIGGRTVKLARTYADAPVGGLLALMNSDGLLEIAVRNGSAAETLGVSRGAELRLLG